MVSDEALKKLQEQIAAWPMTQRFVVQQLIEDYSNIRKDLLAYKNTGLTPESVEALKLSMMGKTIAEIVDALENIPAADVAPVVHGRWVSVAGKRDRICSRCLHNEPYKNADDDAEVFEFCPHCGAKMDGGDSDAAD